MQVLFDNRKKSIKHKGDVSALLKKLNVLREEVVVKVNGKLVPDTRALSDSDNVEVIKVVFGG
jgi:thiamine biosynthesis protein ThiS